VAPTETGSEHFVIIEPDAEYTAGRLRVALSTTPRVTGRGRGNDLCHPVPTTSKPAIAAIRILATPYHGSPPAASPYRRLVFHFTQPVRALEHIARLAAVGWSDDAVALGIISENASGASVAEAQMALAKVDVEALPSCNTRRTASSYIGSWSAGFLGCWLFFIAGRRTKKDWSYSRPRLGFPNSPPRELISVSVTKAPCSRVQTGRSRRQETACRPCRAGARRPSRPEWCANPHARGYPKTDPRRKISLDKAGETSTLGRCVASTRCMPTAARHLRQAGDAFLHVAPFDQS